MRHFPLILRGASTVSEHDSGATGGFVDRVKGTAKTLAGTITGNEDLKREGALHHEKADATETAAHLEATAAREQAKAELTAREREIEVERHRVVSEAAAETREQQAEHERVLEEAKIAARTDAQEAAVDQQAAAREQALNREERQAAAERVAAEGRAEQLKAQAANAERTAAALDSTAEEIA